jgi:hypothetical protein
VRTWAEQNVKRLRKPVGVAQPSEASLVWVAASVWIRRRGENPMEGQFVNEPFSTSSAVSMVSVKRFFWDL